MTPSSVEEQFPTFEQVVTTLGSHVWRVLRYLGVRESEIEDAAQEVFMALVHRRLGELEAPAALRAWVTSICVKVASNARRKQQNRREELVAEVPDTAEERSSEAMVQRKQVREMLMEVLGQLDDDKRTVFVLFEIEDLDMNEIASMLDCPLKTAYSRLYAARRWVTDEVRIRLEGRGA